GAHAMALAVNAAPGFGRRSGRPGAVLQVTGVPNRSGRGFGHRSGRGPDGVRTPVRTGPGNSGGPPPPTGGGGPAGVSGGPVAAAGALDVGDAAPAGPASVRLRRAAGSR